MQQTSTQEKTINKKGNLIFKGGKSVKQILCPQLLAKSKTVQKLSNADLCKKYKASPTAAEQFFNNIQQIRFYERLNQKIAQGNHKQKIERFNKKLAAQSDHNDIPKIGPV